MKYTDIAWDFDGLITKEEMRELKPAPGGMIDLCKQYQVDPKQMLMVGDRAVDIDSAKNAGADACFYNTNGITVPEGTDFEVENLSELPGYL
ncbi:MAG: HAD family hydrolase [Lachnospiraceae bacterium]|nr:HAD family hydrolase [Lachnospiraceae bacterium]